MRHAASMPPRALHQTEAKQHEADDPRRKVCGAPPLPEPCRTSVTASAMARRGLGGVGPGHRLRLRARLALMAISCNLLVGYGERRKGELFLFVLPVIVSLSFFVIADLDSPLGGVIRVAPQNLMAASQSKK